MEPIFLHSKSHETSRTHESNQSPNGLDYDTSLAYAQEVKSNQKGDSKNMTRKSTRKWITLRRQMTKKAQKNDKKHNKQCKKENR